MRTRIYRPINYAAQPRDSVLCPTPTRLFQTHLFVRKPRRFRQPIPTHTSIHQVNRLLQGDQMTDAHKNRLYIGSGADHCPELIIPIKQRRPGSPVVRRLGICADESGFCAPDRRQPGHHTQMACQPEPARMRQPLAVTHQYIRHSAYHSERFQQNGRFPKRKQPGHVREQHPPACKNRFYHTCAFQIPNHHGGQTAARRKRHVQTGDKSYSGPEWRDAHSSRQPLLDPDSLRG